MDSGHIEHTSTEHMTEAQDNDINMLSGSTMNQGYQQGCKCHKQPYFWENPILMAKVPVQFYTPTGLPLSVEDC